jgi:uncharacterized membrane protein SpoIIM required for sporulation
MTDVSVEDVGLKLAPSLVLRSSEFRKGREADWRKMEQLVTLIDTKGLSALSTDDVQRLPLLYRSVISSLSVARSIALDRNMILYLENLALRSYFVVYGPRYGLWESLVGFLRYGFPRAVRGALKHIVIAALAIISGGVAGYMLVHTSESWLGALIPESLSGGRGANSTAQELRNTEIFAPWPGFLESFVYFANFLFRHNTSVGLLTFGLGILGGVPTLLLLFYQGLTFGAFIALHANRGLLIDFLGWVTIHGVTEFGAIILCGAGGLLIAEKILFPGVYGRLNNLARHGSAASAIMGGAFIMFFIAGLIEGGFRQLINDTNYRFIFGLATALLWLWYFSSGRKESKNDLAS